MNPPPENAPNPDAIRSEIDSTRQRMDETLDAIRQRMRGRHLLDEVVGFFRSDHSEGEDNSMKLKIKDSASSALNSAVSTVKDNPVPALLIGAGLGWIIYQSMRSGDNERGGEFSGEYGTFGSEESEMYEHASASGSYGYGSSGAGPDYSATASSSEGGSLGSKLHSASDSLRDKAAQAKDTLRQGASQLGQRASELGSRVADSSREVYSQARDRVARTAEEHPLGLGLGCLAAGIAIGLALPTPRRLNSIAGPRVDRLRDRVRGAGRDLVERGKRVVGAATDAAKHEAEEQGLTPEAMRERMKGESHDEGEERSDRPSGENRAALQPAQSPQAGAPSTQ